MRKFGNTGTQLQPKILGDNCCPIPEIEEVESEKKEEAPFCYICYKPLNSNKCKITGCNHDKFCFSCLSTSIIEFQNEKCPICRGLIDKIKF